MACRRLLAPSFLVLATAAGCTNASTLERVGVADERVTVEQARGTSCSTDVVKGLSLQIVAEANCLAPGAFVAVPAAPNLTLGSAVFAYLEQPARDAFAAALASNASSPVTVNSMLRTVAQQYLLYAWYQNAQCSIGLAAAPGGSNHESGLAVDVEQYAAWQTALEGNGFQWFGTSDPVHYDYVGTGAVDYRGTDVKAFQILWNRNNPTDLIAEDGAYGPQTEARLQQSPADGFPIGADCIPPPSPGADLVPSIAIDAPDVFADHASTGVPDLFVGDVKVVTASVLDQGSQAASSVEVSLEVGEPYLAPVSYTIESDRGHPGSFATTPANDDPHNPPHDAALGPRLDFALGKLEAGETKRVRLRLRAKTYSIGLVDSAFVHFWVEDVPGVYHQADFGKPPSVSKGQTFDGGQLQVAQTLDVYDHTRWEWNSSRLEGWTGTGDSTLVTDGATALLIGSASSDPGAQSPPIAFPAEGRTISLRARRTGGTGTAKVLFTTSADPAFGADKAFAIALPDDDAFHALDVQGSSSPAWKGTVTALRFSPFEGGMGSADLDYLRVEGAGGGAGSSGGGGAGEPTNGGTGCACEVAQRSGSRVPALAAAALLAFVRRRRARRTR